MAFQSQQTLVIGNRLSEFARVEAWLAQLLEQWAISTELAFAIDLVLNETVTNVISYAYEDTANHQIAITITDGPEAVGVEVVDDGKPFDPLQAPKIVTAHDLEHAAIGGRGIHLIKSYADEHYYRRIAGHNRLTLLLRKRP